MPERLFFLDTETTGIDGKRDSIVEIAIVDQRGAIVLNTFVSPGRPIPWQASAIHGITDEMVSDAPSFKSLWPEIKALVGGAHVVIYNASFDCQFFPDRLKAASRVSCAMMEFAEVYGERGSYGRDNRWQKLEVAARHVGHKWTGKAHRALADALACRSVWNWLRKNT